MEQRSDVDKLMRSWRGIPRKMERSVKGLTKTQLWRQTSSGMSPHEIVHHIAEANIVAASMMIAAIGKDGATYDWSWLWPNLDWVNRMGYPKAPIGPAIKTVGALNELVANLVNVNPKVLKRKVTLFDTPGGKTYTMTVEEIMRHEVSHADEHLAEIKRR